MTKKNQSTFKKTVFIFLLLIALVGGQAFAQTPLNQETFEGILKLVESHYINEVSEKDLREGALHGMLKSLDPHSAYYTQEEYKRFFEDVEGAFGGIGITVTLDEKTKFIKVVAPIDGTPGSRAGIESGDLITHVNGRTTYNMTLKEAVGLMRGKAGTKIRLGIQREKTSTFSEIDVVREIIDIKMVKVNHMDNGIAHIQIRSFDGRVAQEVEQALKKAKSNKKLTGVIIDLRNNPGGYLDEVVKIADMVLPKGDAIVHVDYRKGEDKTLYSEKEPIWKGPLAVLIDRGSASASEILAGAIQDSGTGRLFGTRSHGKGTVQSVTELTTGGGIKLTVAEYLTAQKRKVDKVGILPDEIIEDAVLLKLKNYAPMPEDRIYKKGDVGLNVYGAQQRLLTLGFDVKETGTLDEKTVKAVMAFQKQTGIEESGTLDVKTKEGLKNAFSSGEAAADKVLEAASLWVLGKKKN